MTESKRLAIIFRISLPLPLIRSRTQSFLASASMPQTLRSRGYLNRSQGSSWGTLLYRTRRELKDFRLKSAHRQTDRCKNFGCMYRINLVLRVSFKKKLLFTYVILKNRCSFLLNESLLGHMPNHQWCHNRSWLEK